MRKAAIFSLVFLCIVAAGCGSFSTMQAIEYVREAYALVCPADSRPVVLATEPYGGGKLVLVKSASEKCGDFIDLFTVGPEGVTGIAAGISAGQDHFSVNQLQADNWLIIFGEFAQKERMPGLDERVPDEEKETPGQIYENVKITLNNWQIIERTISGEKGFILLLKSKSSVAKFDLYSTDEKLLARLDDPNRINSRVRTSRLIPLADLPLPFVLSADEIEEVTVEPFANEDAPPLILIDRDDFAKIVATLAENHSGLKRVNSFHEPQYDIAFTVSGARKMILRRIGPAKYIVTYSKGKETSHFLLETDELNSPVAGLEKKYNKIILEIEAGNKETP